MDLNFLLHIHQIHVIKANATSDEKSRQIHLDKAALHAEEIGSLRVPPLQAVTLLSSVSADTLSYGTYAWDRPVKPTFSLDSWENEGGAVRQPDVPDALETKLTLTPQYFVGSAVFSDLAQAVAEHARQKSDKLQGDN
ncbi:hypothetical protein [Novosphingobium sp. PP1Y]|uniref:hypothetical protein n=1 Tax=Novosphingobium sp. PP1Y TaxID=702113 RepID=UPI0005A018D2|nr:hypothetical protein [Novosphingobium sp. PP1Y]